MWLGLGLGLGFILGLLEENVNENKGEQNESFYVIDQEPTHINDENSESTMSLQYFLDDEFYSVKINRSKRCHRNSIESKLAVNPTRVKDQSEFIKRDDEQILLIKRLNKQMDFLQNELINKNEIIKSLINDNNVPSHSQLNTDNRNVPIRYTHAQPKLILKHGVVNSKTNMKQNKPRPQRKDILVTIILQIKAAQMKYVKKNQALVLL